MRAIAAALLIVAVTLCARPAIAAQDSMMQELVLRDGSRLYGAVDSETPDEIVFRTHSGAVITVKRADVSTLRTARGAVVDGEFHREDPNQTRLLFGPTARAVPKGQTYLGVFGIVMPFVQVGVTDRFSIGGGTPLIAGFDDWERPFWVTPKLQVYGGDRAQLAVGAMHVFDTGGDGGGIAYSVGTMGKDSGSLTIGAGVAYTGSGADTGVLMVGGERRVSRRLKLVTENYIWSGGTGIGSGGIRFIGEKLSADLGLAFPVGDDSFFVFPVVNFVYVF